MGSCPDTDIDPQRVYHSLLFFFHFAGFNGTE